MCLCESFKSANWGGFDKARGIKVYYLGLTAPGWEKQRGEKLVPLPLLLLQFQTRRNSYLHTYSVSVYLLHSVWNDYFESARQCVRAYKGRTSRLQECCYKYINVSTIGIYYQIAYINNNSLFYIIQLLMICYLYKF
jgi:hypothetical protein